MIDSLILQSVIAFYSGFAFALWAPALILLGGVISFFLGRLVRRKFVRAGALRIDKNNSHFAERHFNPIPFTALFTPNDHFLWYKPGDFRQVLEVCRQKKLGVKSIEVWKGGYADTRLCADYGDDPFNTAWYEPVFEELLRLYADGDETVLFCGTYSESR
jgi:hypothetical protein